MHTILSFLAALEGHPTIAALPFSTLLIFLQCAHRLKDDILQPQPHFISVDAAPEVLPSAIMYFFASFLGIPIDAVTILWSVVGNVVWSLPPPEEADALEEDAFRQCSAHIFPMLADTAFTPDNLYPLVSARNPFHPYSIRCECALIRPSSSTFHYPSGLRIFQKSSRIFQITLSSYHIHLDFPLHAIDHYPSPSVHS
jgi:hypothetical protein